ncbi:MULTISPECIES: hypothetical protein [unclassified Polaribacter]|jgi:hypothetical protein|uniref:hypothetical protein n=1 Tax=unclassified Polaribacter TaxID=196858 RepID=UPI0011BE8796|nr:MULTISPECIES: hypothetical protein [unclassified Polaribacter]TXD52790.1 hypothetical protein ES043_07080 [Polaribacter sp. IC063]TXD61667.1 hypothetical protein ES044_04040 [Polaribacter sp. IC066]
MKKLYTIAFVLFIAAAFSFTTKKQVNQNIITATYKGIDDNEYYKFIDESKNEILFYDFDEDLEYNLFEEEYIDIKFSVTWITKELELTDDEGELTGEKIKIKSITALKVIK